MVWNATLGGNNSPSEEQKIARAIKALADDLGSGVSFWTSNTPIDLDTLGELDTESKAPQVPAKKAKK